MRLPVRSQTLPSCDNQAVNSEYISFSNIKQRSRIKQLYIMDTTDLAIGAGTGGDFPKRY